MLIYLHTGHTDWPKRPLEQTQAGAQESRDANLGDISQQATSQSAHTIRDSNLLVPSRIASIKTIASEAVSTILHNQGNDRIVDKIWWLLFLLGILHKLFTPLSAAPDGNPPVATRASVKDWLAVQEITAPEFSVEDWLAKLETTAPRPSPARDMIEYVRVGSHFAKQYTGIQEAWANVEELRAAVGDSCLLLKQEVELLRKSVAATVAKFEACDRAVNAVYHKLRQQSQGSSSSGTEISW